MKKHILKVFICQLLFICYKAKSQNLFNTDTAIINCQLNQIKKIDTLNIAAEFNSIGKISQHFFLKKLANLKLIKRKDYSSAISFSVGNSKYYLPYRDNIDSVTYKTLLRPSSISMKIRLNVISIRGFTTYKSKPFFLINKVLIDNPTP